MTDADTKVGDKGAPKKLRQVPIAWEALEDAFENNAHEVHSYLHLETGEVIRVVDGIADPAMHHRIMADSSYLRIDPVSSREQYRWMERFIATVEDGEFRQKLVQSIDGKGAFRRFKDVLMSFPVDRERWFSFRSERLRSCMEAWLTAHGIEPIERPQWRVPAADEAKAQETATGTPVATRPPPRAWGWRAWSRRAARPSPRPTAASSTSSSTSCRPASSTRRSRSSSSSASVATFRAPPRKAPTERRRRAPRTSTPTTPTTPTTTSAATRPDEVSPSRPSAVGGRARPSRATVAG